MRVQIWKKMIYGGSDFLQQLGRQRKVFPSVGKHILRLLAGNALSDSLQLQKKKIQNIKNHMLGHNKEKKYFCKILHRNENIWVPLELLIGLSESFKQM